MSVIEQDRSYRRGLVLGLTMAEIVTLVIFCLLLAFGVVLQQRELELSQLKGGLAPETLRLLQKQFPKAVTLDDFKRFLEEQAESAKVVEQLRAKGADIAHLQEDARVGAAIREQKAGEDPGADWPPFFKLSEADGYYFVTGSATPAPKLRQDLSGSIADNLDAQIRKWKINVVEVVGHTDEQPMRGETNLDLQLVPLLNNANASVSEKLQFGDNAGLGMARAAEVVRILRRDPRFQNVSILPLSAAQSIFPVDRLANGTNSGDVEERRRIEIRLRRFSQEMPSK